MSKSPIKNHIITQSILRKEGLHEVRMKLLCFHSNFIYQVHIPKH